MRPILFIGRTQVRGEVTSDQAIYSVSSDGSGLQRLTTGSGGASFPAWSRDGRQIAFASGAPAGSVLWVMGTDGSNPRPASPDFPSCPYGYTSLTWDPSGNRLAAQCFWNVFVFDLRTGASTSITSAFEDTMKDPDWSPDGNRIAFGDPFAPDVFTRAPDGTGRTRLLQDASDPAWSPNGSRVAFVGGTSASAGIYVANVDGTGRLRVTTPGTSATDEGPTWSPDGQWLAFHRRWTLCVPITQAPGQTCFLHWGVFVVRPDGSELRSITPDSLQATRPAW
jgi:TolB protein